MAFKNIFIMQQCERECERSTFPIFPFYFPAVCYKTLSPPATDSFSCNSYIYMYYICMCNMCKYVCVSDKHVFMYVFSNFIHRFATAHISLAQGWCTRCRLFIQSILSHSHHKTRGRRQLSVHCQERCWIYIE